MNPKDVPAWMWQYIGPDPMRSRIKPCARSVHELDPHNNPYPDHWKPLHPLYSAEQIRKLREALKPFVDCDFTYLDGKVIESDSEITREQVIAARIALQETE